MADGDVPLVKSFSGSEIEFGANGTKVTKTNSSVRSTGAQIKLLVDYMSTNVLFAAGEFSGPLGPQRHEAEWTKLAERLGEVGPQKSVTQWKHTWRDLKAKAREEGGRAKRARAQTGNNVPVPEVSEKTKIILDTIGQELATGIEVEAETGVGVEGSDPIFVPPSQFIDVEETVPPPPQFIDEAEEGPSASTQTQRRKQAGKLARVRRGTPKSNTALFISIQQDTNKLLQDLKTELQVSNDIRREQLCLLQQIATRLDLSRYGHP